MAEMVKSAIVGEAVSRIISRIAPTSKRPDRSVEEAAGDGGLERLEMAHIKMEAALHTSDKWQITDVPLLHWRKKLKRAAQHCDDVARRCRQLFQEEEEAEQVVRQSSFPRQIAHATKVFISSLVGRDNDHYSASSTTTAAVRRFEKLADGASEFEQITDISNVASSRPIVGTTVKCLRLLTPNFKSTADIVIREIIQFPTQDFSCVAHKDEHWNNIHRTLVRWFRPDPLCCQGYEHNLVPSCHNSGDNARGKKIRFSRIFPEPACVVFLRRHISVSKYNDLPGVTAVVGHEDMSSLENSPPLKLGILFLPHDSLEDPKSDGFAVEVIDRDNSHHLTHT
ncbi:unnamed protein product [Triticum turgidum subsp. durum]|uniref:Uncharacterized protein n=1 Tax=Triticum turgidum subsp. durum TaxID=4567 RepID=A0A9R1QYD3_TRITD|nr:unnamed protein product [Triticum turgidum subsp. durum]